MKLILITICSVLLLTLGSCTKYYDCKGYYAAFNCSNGKDTINGISYIGQDSNWYYKNIQHYTNLGYSCYGYHSQYEKDLLNFGGKKYWEANGLKCTSHY